MLLYPELGSNIGSNQERERERDPVFINRFVIKMTS